MARLRTVALLAAGAAAIAGRRHARRHDPAAGGHHHGHDATGDVLLRGAGFYDAASSLLLGGLFRRIAAHVAAAAPPGARVLEVGCGPGHLATLLAREHGLEVLGVDLDPRMVARAHARAARASARTASVSFGVADVAALPMPDGSFDVVLSTFSVHHWADPAAGLTEIARVLRPGGRALLWDLRSGGGPGRRHAHAPDLEALAAASPLRVLAADPWRWPGPMRLSQRVELLRADGS